LRERREDIPSLAAHFLGQYTQRYRKPLAAFDPSSMRSLMDHPWPGNVRELQHAVERAVLVARGESIQPVDLGLRLRTSASPPIEDMSLEQVEALLIRKTLARHNNNVVEAAQTLGLSRSAMYRRLQRYDIRIGNNE